MAKVKIQGHASGTGVLTVTAPNTSTDRTITLPDATGTLLNSDGDGSSLTGVADATKLPLAGGTLTGNVTVSASGADASRTLSLQGTNGSSEVYQFNLIADGGNSAAKFMIGSGGGAASEKLRIQSGGGISFNGDSAAANALDDYEEGTWTPVSITGTATSASGTYTRVGRIVVCNGTLNFPSQTNSGHATVGGLPFTTLNHTTGFTGAIRYTNYATRQLMLHGNGNATTFNLYAIQYGDNAHQTSYTDVSAKRLDFQVTYFVA